MKPCREQEEAQKEQNSKRGDDLADMDGADKQGKTSALTKRANFTPNATRYKI